LRIVFMGSPEIAVPSLEKINSSGWEIMAVYTQPDRQAGRGRAMVQPPIKAAALKMGLTVEQPESLKEPEALAKLKSYKPDVIVVCAFGQILTQALLDIPPKQCVNVHFSLLPKHRGAAPVAAAILAGDELSGVSIQIVRVKLDSGPLLASAAIPISPIDNTGTLMEKLSIVGADLLQEALTGWQRGEITPRNQDENEASYFGQVKKEEGEIDWKKPAVEIWRHVRAFYPWPGCFTYWKGKQLKINEATVIAGGNKSEPGRVMALKNDESGIGIATGDGILKVLRLQYEGKRDMKAEEFIRGQRGFMDTRLPN
jgi:methionyl-tRNA formyltransferase